jgi:UDP-galactopyranose mutase
MTVPDHYRYLIVGAGFTGSVLAREIASKLGERVLVVDRRQHIAGNAFDELDHAGILIHRFGPHIFHTNSAAVFSYLSQFTTWRPYEHRVRGYVDGRFMPIPFNITSLEMAFGLSQGRHLTKLLTDEFGLGNKVPILKMRQSSSAETRRVADFIYEKVFLHYTTKQWGLRPEELDPSVSARVPVHLSYDDRYFQDDFQFMPEHGYTRVFQAILDHPLIEVQTGVGYPQICNDITFDRLIYTGPIDEFFEHSHGELPYRSLRFEMKTSRSSDTLQKVAQENYPTPLEQHPYTRTTEFRILTGQSEVEFTTQAFEYPIPYRRHENEPYYPVPKPDNQELYRKYMQQARKLKSVFFAGRLADYSYYNMDQAVARALACFSKEITGASNDAHDSARI